MKNRFVGHYRPTEDDFKQLWADCLFLPDANILLHLFRYGEKTRAQVLSTLQQLKPRVWIPYQVGVEFHKNWRNVDQTNRDAYDKLTTNIDELGRKMTALFNDYTRHQTIDVELEKQAIKDFVKALQERLEQSRFKHPAHEDAELVFNQISDMVGDAVGECPPSDALDELIKEGEIRFAALTPPGYRDAKTKKGADKFGDLLIWKEALNKSRETKKPIIIITDDNKEDWWQEHHGRTIGPRPELIAEMMQHSGQQFYMYTLSQFLDYAETFLGQKIDAAAIDEIKSDENQLREVAARRGVAQHASLRRATRDDPIRLKSPEETWLLSRRKSLVRRLTDLDMYLEEAATLGVNETNNLGVLSRAGTRLKLLEAMDDVSQQLQNIRSIEARRSGSWHRKLTLSELIGMPMDEAQSDHEGNEPSPD